MPPGKGEVSKNT